MCTTPQNESNPNSTKWIRQFREVANDIQDVLDKYMLRLRPRDTNGLCGCIDEAYVSIKNLGVRHQIASDIKAIKNRLQNVSAIQQRYKIAGTGQSSTTLPKNERYYVGGADEDEAVGIKEPMEKLVKWIHSKKDGLEVISVVGMGGLGKTTLVKQVYNDESVKKHFDRHVWIVASDNKDNEHMLLANFIKKLVAKFKESQPEDVQDMSADEMREFIYQFLKEKKYIIVMDDVWNISAWKTIKSALPKEGSHGCIIMTTRFDTIANAACSKTDLVYKLKPLGKEESGDLFYKITFPRSSCPPYVRVFAEKILNKCEGLPLAISVIGGLLATKDCRAEEWEVFERRLAHELLSGGSLEILGKSLILSYNDLPYYLKNCYMYLSIFPKDGLMEKEKIIRLWIAEGLVEQKPNMTMEEVAIDNLNHLSSRSLIQVAEKNIDGRARAFRIHNLLHEYIISKSAEQNIVNVFNGGEMRWPSKIRRLAIQKSFSFSRETSNLESLYSLVLCCENVEVDMIKEMVDRCRLLKVLDLRGAPLNTIPNGVFKLLYLKSLSLRGTMVKIIPKSIKNLENLETLDLKNCSVTKLPVEILELRRLRHLIVYKYKCFSVVSFDSIQSCKVPCGIGESLPLLLKLCAIEATESSDGVKIVREIGKLAQLRRITITKLRSEDGKELCSSIAKLTNLRSIRIDSLKEDEKLDLEYPVSLPFLRLLQLNGCMEKVPAWIGRLDGLTTLIIAWSRLKEDPLTSLQDLPNLASLWIHGAYVEELIFKAQGFKKLKELGLAELKYLKAVRVEKGSMPLLKDWHIRGCKLFVGPPQGFDHLTNLQVFLHYNMAGENLHALTSRSAH